MKKCAIVIAAYNCPEYILQSYYSVKNQLPAYGWEYEIRIGVDNCKKTSERLGNIKHYYSDENVGHLIMRNSIIEAEPAEAYAYFDADDVMHPDFLKECLKQIEKGENIILPAKLQCNEKLEIKKDKPVIESGGAMVFTHAVVEKIGGFPPYRCAGDTDFMERAKMAGFKIHEIKTALYKRRLHDNNLTRSGETIQGGEYRKESWRKMCDDRNKGIIYIKPTTTELKTIERQDDSTPIYLLIRTSNRPLFFNNMMESVRRQTYKNIITIVYSDNLNDKYVTGDIVIHGEKETSGTAPYNLYCNALLDNVPDNNGYYMFLDDDDMFFTDDALEKFIANCKKDKINVARVMRWNFEIFPKRWGQDLSFQTECFMLHNSHRNRAKWWDKKGGDHYYTRQLTDQLQTNWIDNLIVCKTQDGKGHGRCFDLQLRPESLDMIPDNKQVPVLYLDRVITPQTARGRQGEVKMIIYRRAKMLENKGYIRILPEELYRKFVQSGRKMEVLNDALNENNN